MHHGLRGMDAPGSMYDGVAVCRNIKEADCARIVGLLYFCLLIAVTGYYSMRNGRKKLGPTCNSL